MAETIFGSVIKNSDGREIPTRIIGENHMVEDFGWVPSVSDWLNEVNLKDWMFKKSKKLSKNTKL